MAFRSIALFSEAPYHEASSANHQMKLRIVPITFAALAAASAVAMVCAQQQTPPEQVYRFQDPNLPVEQRVNNIISLMTLDEKIACLGTNPNVPRLGIRGTGHSLSLIHISEPTRLGMISYA